MGNLPNVLVATGSHYDFGYDIGKRCSEIAKRMDFRFKKEVKEELGASLVRAISFGRKVLPFIEEYYPDFLDELRGYSDGSGVTFEDLIAQWSGYSPSFEASRGCTDVIVAGEHSLDGRSVYACHNEDYSPEFKGEIVPVHGKIKGKPEFFTMSYGGIFPTIGFNENGISITGNALSPNDLRLGIPKMYPPRKVLEARTIGEALEYSTPEKRGDSFNNICTSSEGEIYSMEGSATDFEPIYGEEGCLVHTNHYLSPRMQKYESNLHKKFCSIVRYNRALKLLRKDLGKVSEETLMAILRDHVNYPNSICRHVDERELEKDRCRTLFSAIVNLTSKTILVCDGNPCEGAYLEYRLS